MVEDKVRQINHGISPIQNEYIEKFHLEKELNLTAVLAGKAHIRGQILSLLQHRQTMTAN